MIGNKKNTRGFTIFFAMLAASLSLAVGLAIYDLTAREIDLSSTATQSQYAIYAADTGAECALYWDSKAPVLNGASSAFGTTTGAGNWQASGVLCNGTDIAANGAPPPADAARYLGCATSGAWCIQSVPNAATTTFSVSIPSGGVGTYCAVVQVGKYTDPSGALYTNVVSRGYNTCTGTTRFERTLQVNY